MTILSPIVMVALIFAPIWLAQLSSDEVRQIAIIDQTGLYKNIYENSEEYQFTYTQGILNPAEMRAEESQPYAYVIIKDNLLNNPKGMTIYSQKQITNSCESMITSQMEEFLKNEKLLSYNIPNIKQIIDDSDINLHVDTIRLEEDGAETQTSSEMVMVIGMAMTLIIYMFLMLYGGQVMSSVMQEKTNRIVEVMVSSVKPFELMIGKITSIGLVGLTQLGIWILFIIGIFLSVGAIFSFSGGMDTANIENMTAVAGSMNGVDAAQLTGKMGAMQEIQNMLGSINLTQLLICFVLFFIGGYILYASLFAAIGSAVDNESDAAQFMVPITFKYHLRPICRHIQCRESRRTVSHVVFDDTVYLPHRNDGKNPLWGIYMGVDSIDDYSLRFCHWTGVGSRKNIPGGNTHVWQKAQLQRNDKVDTL